MRVARKKKKRKQIENRLDLLWAECVKAKAHYISEKSGRKDCLQSAHIVTRSNKSTRWLIINGCCITAGEHLWWAHKEPLEFHDWLIKTRGKKVIEDLKLKSRIIVKRTITDLLWLEKELQQKLQKLKEADNAKLPNL